MRICGHEGDGVQHGRLHWLITSNISGINFNSPDLTLSLTSLLCPPFVVLSLSVLFYFVFRLIYRLPFVIRTPVLIAIAIKWIWPEIGGCIVRMGELISECLLIYLNRTRRPPLLELKEPFFRIFRIIYIYIWPPLWSSGQSFWLQIQRSRVRSPALPDFLSSSVSGTGSTQPREVNWGATWMKAVAAPGLENRD